MHGTTPTINIMMKNMTRRLLKIVSLSRIFLIFSRIDFLYLTNAKLQLSSLGQLLTGT